jgi:hypothetical protein
VWRLEEKSDRDVASYLYEEYLLKETLAEFGVSKTGERIFNKVTFSNDGLKYRKSFKIW